MLIPIQNIYYLLCYAWGKLPEREVVAVDPTDAATLPDLFARVLVSGTKHLLRRGFDRGYVHRCELMSRLRGRVRFEDAVRTGLTLNSRLPCDCDELSYDILHNQILKATMRQLLRSEGLGANNSRELFQLCRLFSDVQDIEVTSRVFGQVQLYQNTRFYDFLLKVCELVHRNLLPTRNCGSGKFMDFVQDEAQMRVLFESFVRTFYRVHTDYRVKREDIHWKWIAADEISESLLPKMQTDISLTSDTRKIIIDCKFTPQATGRHYEAEKLRSSHLYQIHAYLNNLREGTLTDRCEIMLLYPTVDTPLCASYSDRGRTVSIRTINLNQSWHGIHKDLLAIVN